MNKRLRQVLQYAFFLALGIFLVWFSIKDLTSENRSQIKAALKTARYYLIVPVFIILILSHYLRALRWRLLIEPLGYTPARSNTFFAVLIGYLANLAFPRLGEVLKCAVLARYEKIPADKLIGTIILERIIDAVTLLIVFAITLAIQPDLYSKIIDTFFSSPGTETQKKIPTWIIGAVVIGLLIIGIAAWMVVKKKKLSDLIDVFKKITRSVWQGLSAIRQLKKRTQFIILTVALWTLYLSGGYIGFMALQETQHYGVKEAFTVLSAGSVGMIITPGGIGAYAFLLQRTMELYGLSFYIALAFGWLLWIAQTAVILLGGLFSFVALPYFNKRKLRETA